jgi:hypothetical protein
MSWKWKAMDSVQGLFRRWKLNDVAVLYHWTRGTVIEVGSVRSIPALYSEVPDSYLCLDTGSFALEIQWSLGSGTPLFTNNSVHEQIFRAKTSRMTNGVSDYEHASWQQRQAESISAGVSWWLTLAQKTSLLDFGLRTFRFTNGLQERISSWTEAPLYFNLFPQCLKAMIGGSSVTETVIFFLLNFSLHIFYFIPISAFVE